jgi:Domain of unknown function (DUF4385)
MTLVDNECGDFDLANLTPELPYYYYEHPRHSSMDMRERKRGLSKLLMGDTSYADAYRGIDFRKHPEKYVVGRGEQGVLIAEPYKSEILPHWRFASQQIAKESAERIYAMFGEYGEQNDFVGMDMARKFLQMGFTRARRYANHPSGKKYDADNKVIRQADDWKDSEKAKAAEIFYSYYVKAKSDKKYLELKRKHLS